MHKYFFNACMTTIFIIGKNFLVKVATVFICNVIRRLEHSNADSGQMFM